MNNNKIIIIIIKSLLLRIDIHEKILSPILFNSSTSCGILHNRRFFQMIFTFCLLFSIIFSSVIGIPLFDYNFIINTNGIYLSILIIFY